MTQISVLISAYNEEDYILECLSSFLNCSEDFCLLLYNDGSTDSTHTLICDFISAHPSFPIQYYHSKINKGKIFAYNFLFIKSVSPFISFFGADDICPIDRFALQLSSLQRADYVYSSFLTFSSDVRCTSLQHAPSIINIPFRNVMHGGTLAFNRKAASIIFPLPSQLPAEDWFTSLTLLFSNLKGLYINSPTILYRLHPNSDSGSLGFTSFAHFQYLTRRELVVLDTFLQTSPSRFISFVFHYSRLCKILMSSSNLFYIVLSCFISLFVSPFSLHLLRSSLKGLILYVNE